MSTYLKNMVGYKHNQLKNKSFDDIQKLFDKAMKRVNKFVDMDTELVEGSEVRAEGMDEDKETTELQRLIEIVPDKEEVAIDAIPLATNPLSIIEYKIHKEGKKTYYQIIRVDGSSKMYLVFSHMLKSFDREDLETLWKLVKAKHGLTRPEEGYDRVLWGDLKTMFEPHVEDQVWRNQQDYRVLDWKIYESCGVHSLRMQHMHIHILVEKRYPLTPATITDMLNKKLQCDQFSKMLLMKKLEILKKNINFRGGLLGLKDFLTILELLLLRFVITAAKLKMEDRNDRNDLLAESLRRVRVGWGGYGRRPREGNDERVEDLNGQENDQNLLPAMLAQVSNRGNVGNQNGNVVNENVQENVGNVLVNGNRVGCSYKEFLAITFSQDLDLLENHLTKEIISQTDCKTTLTKLRTTFENAFSSEIKARMQNYTRYDAQSFYDAMIFNMDSLGKYMLELILHQQRTPQLLKQKKLMQTQEDHSNPIPALNVDSLKVDLVVIQNTCSEKEDSNSETASSKLVKECSLNSETKDVHAIKYKMSKAKERCMEYFRSLHSHLQVLSKDGLKGTRIEHGFKRAFMSLFGQDVDTFTSTMLLNIDQLQKQLDKDEFQEVGSMTAFWVVNNKFQKFIDSKFTLDYDSQMTDTYFVEYTRIEVKHFRDTLLQHLGNVKKSIAERTRHQRQYERRVNKRQMQPQESKIDMGKALDNGLVVIESNGTESEVQDDSSRSRNDTDADDADIKPIYDEEPMLSNKAKIEKEIDVLETMNIELEHSVAKLRKENETLKQHYKDLYDSIKITRSKTTEQTTSLLANNVELKAQIQEKVFAIDALKNDLRKLKGNSIDTKFDKTSVLEKPVLQSPRNQSVVRQPNAFKSERP
ncbi:hypothetical protein Tco_0071267 [Tanacetum coccineum]